MVTSIIHINVEYENGLYAFNGKVPAGAEESLKGTKVITPSFGEEDSLEEIEEAVLKEDGNDLMITWSEGAQALALELTGDLERFYGKKVYIPMGKHEEHIGDRKPADERSFFTTMKNGYDAFVSGVYPQQISNTYAKHVLVHDKEADLRSYVDINSAVFSRNEMHCAQPIYCHKHVIEKEKIRFDNSDSILKREILTYHEYIDKRDRGQLARGREYILKLKSPEDYKEFENDLYRFEKTGFTDTYERRLIDECRWSNGCSLKRMLRFVEKNGKVYPCPSCKESIGKLGDDYDSILRSASYKCDRAIIERKCASCTEHDRCSGCAMLPEGLSKIDFCEFMRRHKLIGEFIVRQHVAAFLAQFSNLFRDDEYIHFGVPGKEFCYPGEEVGKQEILCEKDGKYFYLDTEKGLLMKVG